MYILGTPLLIRSCGVEGFKNTRKGTNIAAQATAISLSAVSFNIDNNNRIDIKNDFNVISMQKAIERGVKNVRIQVRGIGPGRMVKIL